MDHAKVDVLARHHIFSLLFHNWDRNWPLRPNQPVTDRTKSFLTALVLSCPSTIMQLLLFWLSLSLSNSRDAILVIFVILPIMSAGHRSSYHTIPHAHETRVVLTHLNLYIFISIYFTYMLIDVLSISNSSSISHTPSNIKGERKTKDKKCLISSIVDIQSLGSYKLRLKVNCINKSQKLNWN